MKKRKVTFIMCTLILLYIVIVGFFILYTRWDRMGYLNYFSDDDIHKEDIIDIDGVSLLISIEPKLHNDTLKIRGLQLPFDSLRLDHFSDTSYDFEGFYMNRKQEDIWERLKNGLKATFSTPIVKIENEPEHKKTKEYVIPINNENYDLLLPLFLKLTNEQGVEFWEHKNIKDYMNAGSNSIFIYLGKTKENRIYFRTVLRYSGMDELDLKNIIIESNIRKKVSILEVNDDEYSRFNNDIFITEIVDLSPTEENRAFIENHILADSIQITFMGFKKNLTWKVPAEQFKTLKESYSFFEVLKYTFDK